MRGDTYAPPRGRIAARVDRALERGFNAMQHFYAVTLGWALEHRVFMLLVTLATIVLTVRLYTVLPKGFLPLQDTGLLIGSTLASPDVSFQAMEDRQRAVVDVVLADPAVASVGSTVGVSNGWSSINRGSLTVSLKPLSERHLTSE
jgi:multidrug efflux pump